MPLSPADRIALGLDKPGEYQHAGEFDAPGGMVIVPLRPAPNVKLLLREGEKASTPKIRGLVNELIAGNIDNANYWLQQVAAGSPKEALKLLIELAEFTLPKLKAVAVAVDDRSENPKSLSFEALQRALSADQ